MNWKLAITALSFALAGLPNMADATSPARRCEARVEVVEMTGGQSFIGEVQRAHAAEVSDERYPQNSCTSLKGSRHQISLTEADGVTPREGDDLWFAVSVSDTTSFDLHYTWTHIAEPRHKPAGCQTVTSDPAAVLIVLVALVGLRRF